MSQAQHLKECCILSYDGIRVGIEACHLGPERSARSPGKEVITCKGSSRVTAEGIRGEFPRDPSGPQSLGEAGVSMDRLSRRDRRAIRLQEYIRRRSEERRENLLRHPDHCDSRREVTVHSKRSPPLPREKEKERVPSGRSACVNSQRQRERERAQRERRKWVVTSPVIKATFTPPKRPETVEEVQPGVLNLQGITGSPVEDRISLTPGVELVFSLTPSPEAHREEENAVKDVQPSTGTVPEQLPNSPGEKTTEEKSTVSRGLVSRATSPIVFPGEHEYSGPLWWPCTVVERPCLCWGWPGGTVLGPVRGLPTLSRGVCGGSAPVPLASNPATVSEQRHPESEPPPPETASTPLPRRPRSWPWGPESGISAPRGSPVAWGHSACAVQPACGCLWRHCH